MTLFSSTARLSPAALAVLLVGLCHAAPQATARQAASPPAVQSVDPHAAETKAQRDSRMGWWRQARFGMFIHWGLYAVPAGVWNGKPTTGLGEWIMHDDKIPVADYAAYTNQFDPTRFNADRWVGVAKAAGMKYIVMTAKHHEGFAMFHSADPFNVYDATAFKRDPIAEMAAACKRQGIRFGVYYSQAQDWHHPGGAAVLGGHWDAAQDGDLHAYVRTVAAPQVRELLTRYHPAILWWDTPVGMSPEDIKALTAAFPEDPGLIANNRLGNGVPGDTETPEQRIPATGYPGRDWETCMTINDTWGYKTDDTNFKSTDLLLHNLIDIASKGGNYLLNVGPTAQGIIPAPEVQRLADIGAWLKANGAGIYGTTASPFKRLSFDGRATVKGDTLYLHVFRWPDSGLTLTGLVTPVRDARALATGQKLAVQVTPDGLLHIGRPSQTDPLATTVALRLSGSPVVATAQDDPPVAPQADGSYLLAAHDAEIQGGSAQIETSGGQENIGDWTDAKDAVRWTFTGPAARAETYRVGLDYACEPGSAGSTYAVQIDDQTPQGLTGLVVSTGGWQTYKPAALDGLLTVTPGMHRLRIVPLTLPHGAVMNLRRVTLTPTAGK